MDAAHGPPSCGFREIRRWRCAVVSRRNPEMPRVPRRTRSPRKRSITRARPPRVANGFLSMSVSRRIGSRSRRVEGFVIGLPNCLVYPKLLKTSRRRSTILFLSALEHEGYRAEPLRARAINPSSLTIRTSTRSDAVVAGELPGRVFTDFCSSSVVLIAGAPEPSSARVRSATHDRCGGRPVSPIRAVGRVGRSFASL